MICLCFIDTEQALFKKLLLFGFFWCCALRRGGGDPGQTLPTPHPRRSICHFVWRCFWSSIRPERWKGQCTRTLARWDVVIFGLKHQNIKLVSSWTDFAFQNFAFFCFVFFFFFSPHLSSLFPPFCFVFFFSATIHHHFSSWHSAPHWPALGEAENQPLYCVTNRKSFSAPIESTRYDVHEQTPSASTAPR